jgi:glycosyltransferase involved in cell wall biosynthesis
MLVLNGEKVLPRALLPLAGVIDELVVIDSGSEDGTRATLEHLAGELKVDRFYYERLHPCGLLFFTDEKAASWNRGMPGHFTGRRVLIDWAAARNLALDNTTADYILKLDADDELLTPPQNLLALLTHFDTNPHVAIASAPYEVMDGQGKLEWLSMYDRLWRRDSAMRWKQPMHEYLGGKNAGNTMFVPSGLTVRDWRDSPGEGVRIEHRNLKVLLYNWEIIDPRYGSRWALFNDLIFRFTLAHEAAEVFPAWSRELLSNIITRLDPKDVSMLSDCHYHKGRSLAVEGRIVEALAAYEEADRLAPHLQALLKAWAITEAPRMREVWASKIMGLVEASSRQTTPYNCDLKLLDAVRKSCEATKGAA